MKNKGPSIDERVRALIAEKKIDEATTAIIETFGGEIFGFLINVMGNENDADEVFAVFSEKVWRSVGKFRSECSLRTWVYRIARNEGIRFSNGSRRRNRGRASFSELDEVLASIRSDTPSKISEEVGKLNAIRAELPLEDRMLLVLHVDRNLKFKPIARIFLGETAEPSPEDVKREAARLRQRFKAVREKVAKRARDEKLSEKLK
jgi:RNA polymerase sigma-70 factor (ECF subfamily)